MDVDDAEMVFWVVLVLSAVATWAWAVKRRRRVAQKWHERPSGDYRPELHELDDVQRREYRRPL